MPDLSARSVLPEKMDEPGIAHHELHQALRELEILNNTLGGYKVILNALSQLRLPQRTITIIDLGCGGGDMLRAIAKWAENNNKNVRLIGVDRNSVMTEYSAKKSSAYKNISFKTLDVFDDSLLKLKADIAMNSLFSHHFDDDDLIKLTMRMKQIASQAIIINDIHRHWFAYLSVKMLTALFSKTYLVKYDAPVSVARSLILSEWQNILTTAGIENYRIKSMWAWRWQIISEYGK